MSARKPRGPYAKGTAKREEIIAQAIDAFGKTGYHATSMREIAAACNLSQAGLLHYFANKEALLLAIVEYRGANQEFFILTPDGDLAGDWQDLALKQADDNQTLDALTRLWANLVGEGTDPAFPMHEYFKDRYRFTRAQFVKMFALAGGREEPNADDLQKGAIFTAVWDGLQTQWLLDADFDMMPAFRYTLKMLSRYEAGREG